MAKTIYPLVLEPSTSGDRVLSPRLGHMLWARLGASTHLASKHPHAFSVKVMRNRLQVTVYCLVPGKKGRGDPAGAFTVSKQDLTHAERGPMRMAERHAACLYIHEQFGGTLPRAEVIGRAKGMFPYLAWGEDE